MGNFHSKLKHKPKDKSSGSKKDGKKLTQSSNKSSAAESMEGGNEPKTMPVASSGPKEDEEPSGLIDEVTELVLLEEKKTELPPNVGLSFKEKEVSETLKVVGEKENGIIKEQIEISELVKTISVSDKSDSNSGIEPQIPTIEVTGQTSENENSHVIEESTISTIEIRETKQNTDELCSNSNQKDAEKEDCEDDKHCDTQNENSEKELYEVEEDIKVSETANVENVGDLEKESNESKDFNTQADECEDKTVKDELEAAKFCEIENEITEKKETNVENDVKVVITGDVRSIECNGVVESH